ncbi:hypothetical protein V6N13_092313 [Hibiscus sabdariffa]
MRKSGRGEVGDSREGDRGEIGDNFVFSQSSREIALERAVDNIWLGGFILFGSRISVSYSRFKPRMKYWRKVNQSKSNKMQGSMEQHNVVPSKLTQNHNGLKQKSVMENSISVPVSPPFKVRYPQADERPKVTGFIEEEAL